MDKLKYVRLENEDGSYSSPIPLSVDGEWVNMENEYNLQETIGTINVEEDGSIAEQLAAIIARLTALENQ